MSCVKLNCCRPKRPLDYAPITSDQIKNSLKRECDRQKEVDEFLEYVDWAAAELDKGGQDLVDLLEGLNKRMDEEFKTALKQRHAVNRVINGWDDFTHKIRVNFTDFRRWCYGLKDGYPVEKRGKDLITPWIWAMIYFPWMLLQFTRSATGVLSAMDIDKSHVAEVQKWTTIGTALPYILHVDTQLRQLLHAYADRNEAKLAALLFLGGAQRFMTEDHPTYADANAYRIAMQSYRSMWSEKAARDFRKTQFAMAREVCFLFNLVGSSATSVNLAAVNPPIDSFAAGIIQAVGGGFGFLQVIADVGQGAVEVEAFSSNQKESEALREKCATLFVSGDTEGSVPGPYERGDASAPAWKKPENKQPEDVYEKYWQQIANSGFAAFHLRRAATMAHEVGFGAVRIVKGVGSAVTSVAAVYFGVMQCLQGKPTNNWPLLFSATSSAWSGLYYLLAFAKMGPLRADGENKKIELHHDAQYARLRCTPEQLAGLFQGGETLTFDEYHAMFQHRKFMRAGESVKTQAASLRDNEFVFLDLATHDIACLVESKGELAWQELKKAPLMQWILKNTPAKELDLQALVLGSILRAPNFRKDHIKRGLAKSLKIDLPLGSDGLEKRIRPALLVEERLRAFVGKKANDGKGTATEGARFADDYKKYCAAEDWPGLRSRMLRGTTLEEFIASVLHVYAHAGFWPNWENRHFKMAQLVGLAQYAQEEREAALYQVYREAKHLEGLKVSGQEREEFRNGVYDYHQVDIKSRGQQIKALEKLYESSMMQKILAKSEEPGWLDQFTDEIRYGLELLCERVDRAPVQRKGATSTLSTGPTTTGGGAPRIVSSKRDDDEDESFSTPLGSPRPDENVSGGESDEEDDVHKRKPDNADGTVSLDDDMSDPLDDTQDVGEGDVQANEDANEKANEKADRIAKQSNSSGEATENSEMTEHSETY